MTDFRALCAQMADELDHYRQLLMDDRRETHALAAEARAALAQPEPQGPKLIYRYSPATIAECGGPCEQGPQYCDCGQIKGEPEPQGPTQKEAVALYSEVMAVNNCQTLGEMAEHFARAVLARWGRPAIEPVPVSERPWERGEWCNKEGMCWMGDAGGRGFVPSWRLCKPDDSCLAWSLPHWALPVPNSYSNAQGE